MKTNLTHFVGKMFLSVFVVLMLLFTSIGMQGQTTLTLGTGTATNTSSTYPAPYGNWYWGARHQFLILASELQALGGGAGTITSLAFEVASINGTALQGFTISMGSTTATALSAWTSGLTQVYTSASYTEVSGWNTHSFTTPFVWDGASNIIVETCFNNSGYTNNAITYYTTTAFNSAIEYHADASGVCSSTTISSTSTSRPNMRFVINMAPPSQTDLGILSWDFPYSSCGMSSTTPVSIKFKNWGTASQSSYTLKYSIDNGTTWVSQPMTTTINPGDTVSHTFTTTANFSTVGTYNCKAVVVLPNDSNTVNDTLSVVINSTAGLSIPYFQNFENWTVGVINASSPWPGSGTPSWEVEDATGANENSTATGPFYDHTTEGTAGGKYVYLETSSGSTGSIAYLTSPCVNFGNATAVVMKFWYHMYGATMGTLEVEQKVGGNWVTTGWSLTGQQQSAGNSPWVQATVAINPAADGIRFKGVRGSSFTSDMSIDDVEIFIPQPNDMAMLEWVSPLSGTTPSSTMPITVKFMNFGTATQDTIPVKFSVDGGTTIISEIYNDSVQPGDTVTYTFTATANMATAGYYNVGAVVSNPGDAVGSNDTVFATMYLCTALSGVYTIGPDSNDHFATFGDAAFALANCGVAGPVNFLVDSGVYNEQVVFSAVNGASMVNRITFASATGNADDVVLQFNANSASNYTMKLDGASYYYFYNMTFEALNSSYGTVVEFNNGSHYNTFYGNNIKSIGTSSSNKGINFTTTVNNYNVFKRNNITSGYYGIYLTATSSTVRAMGNVVDSNDISGFYYYGVYSYYQDSISISYNYIHDNIYTYSYGIYTYYNMNGCNYNSNKINMTTFAGSGYSYAMRIYYCNYYSTAPANAAPISVYNNMISIVGPSTGTSYGLYDYYCNDANYYNNSVLIADASTGSRAMYQYNTTSNSRGSNFLNNSFVNLGSGYAAYYGTTGTVDTNDYNNYYSAGTNFVYWGANRTDLTALQTANSMDAGSVSMNPNYFSNTDLHTLSIPFNNLGTPISSVMVDFDGDVRSASTPDIGADEFTPPANDMAVIEWVSPLTGSAQNPAATISVKVANFGTATQSNIPVKYSINGGQTVVTESVVGPLYTGDTATYTFTTTANMSAFGLYDVLAYTDLSNEQNYFNDTTFYAVYACSPFSGTYTLGPDTNDHFSSFNDLAFALANCGVSGAMTVLVDSGYYNESVIFTAVNGASSTNTITIKSASGNAADVVLAYDAATSSDNFTVKFDGADYFSIEDITIQGLDASYGTAVEFVNGATYNKLDGNILISPNGNSNSKVIYDYTTLNHYNTITNNTLIGGYYGIYMYGVSTSSRQVGNIISGNEIKDFGYYALLTYYTDSTIINNNYIHANTISTVYGIYTNYMNNGFEIIGNNVVLSGTYGYGLRIYYSNYYSYVTTPVTGMVANNMISLTGSSTSTSYGIYDYYCNDVKVYYNSVLINDNSTSSRALYQVNTASNTVGNTYVNNIFANYGGGYAAYFSTTASVTTSDYNNFYSNGSNLAYWGANRADLAALQTASSKDANSKSIDPDFFSTSDLHTYNILMANSGTPLTDVTVDIDGEARNATTPDIGADEYTTPANNLGAVDAYLDFDEYCGTGNDSVFVMIKNYGTNTQTNVPVYFVGTTPTGNLSLVGTISSIAPQTTETVFVGLFNATAYGMYNLKAYASLATDTLYNNDTIAGSIEYYAPEALGYVEEFTTWVPAKWDNYYGGTFGWDSYSNGIARANFWNQSAGNYAQMVTPMVTVPAATNAFVGFKYAYYDYTASYQDTLSVYASTCDTSWVLIWKKGGADLVTPGGASTTPGSFVTGFAQVPTAFQGENVQFMFEGFSDYGPDLFIDAVTFATAPMVNLGNDTSFCAGDSMMLDAGTYFDATYLWTRGTDTLGTSQTIYATTAGTYVAHVTQFGVTSTDNVIITVNALPTLVITNLANAYCNNGSAVTLVATPAGGMFSGNGMIGSSFDPALAGLGNHTITYSYTDSLNCSNTLSQSTMVNAAPSVTVSPDVTICEGTSTMLSAGAPAVATDLFFSEYIEGSSNNKAFEIFNGTGDTVYLADYRIIQASNGNGWQYYHTFPAGSYILDGDVWVIVANQINVSLFDTTFADEVLAYPSVVHHNGDDARGIVKVTATDTILIDVIGLPSPDPGSGWAVAGVNNATADHSLIRKGFVTSPDTSWANIAGTDSISSQYMVYPQNYFGNLGMHTMTGPVSYLWSTNATTPTITVSPVNTTTYTVSVTGTNTCTTIDTVVVSVNPAPMINLGADQSICASDAVLLDAGAGYTYMWNNGATTQTIMADSTGIGIGTGNYSVIATDSNMCMGYDTVAITVLAEPVVTIMGDDTIKASWVLNLDAGTGFASYTWTTGWTNQTLTFGANSFAGNTDTIIGVAVMNSDGCYGYDTITIHVIEDVGFGDNNLDINIEVYPNPSNGQFNVEMNGYTGSLEVNIVDVNGKVVYTESVNAFSGMVKGFNLNTLAKGVYSLKLVSSNGVKVEKLIIK